MMKDVKCPVCGSHDIEVDDVIDICTDDDGKGEELLIEDIIGVCQCCDAGVRWKKIYRYSAVEDIEVYDE